MTARRPPNGSPIWEAYADTGALEVSCPHCGAAPTQWCTRDDGRVRRVPCVARSIGAVGTGDGKPYARDFTQQSHPRKDAVS
jgi:hypothetical protein